MKDRVKRSGLWISGCLQKRSPGIIIVLIGIYLYLELDHLHPLFRLLFLAPVLLLLIPAGILIQKALIVRLHRSALRIGPELLVSSLLYMIIVLFFTFDRLQMILMTLVFFWMLFQLFRKKIGLFYTALIGLLIFATIAFSFRLVHLEETLYLTWRDVVRFSRSKHEGLRWSIKSGQNKFILRYPGDSRLVLEYAPGFFIHPAERSGGIELPRPGRLLVSFSRSSDQPFAPPCLALYAVDSDLPQTPGDFRSEWEMILGHGRNEGRIGEVHFQGFLERKPPLSTLSMRGLAFRYRDRLSGRLMQSGFYLLRSHQGRQFLLAFIAPRVKNIPHHPDILFVLRRLNWLPAADDTRGGKVSVGAPWRQTPGPDDRESGPVPN